jgi:hypothetical protein
LIGVDAAPDTADMRAIAVLVLVCAGCSARALGGGTAPDAGPDGPPSLDQMTRDCVRAASCTVAAGGGGPVASPGECVSLLQQSWPGSPIAARLVSCGATATDCASFFSCLGGDLIPLRGYAVTAACDGDSIVQGGRRFDCRGLGLTCVSEMMGDRTYCAARACPDVFSASCDGNAVDQCVDGVWRQIPCDACANAMCVGTGAPCDPARTPGSCAGSVATVCLNGRLSTADCSLDPLRTTCSNGQCVYPFGAPQCLLGNGMCDGTTAVVCAGTEWRRVDCRTLGFQGCAPAGGTQEVVCR